jgi:ATP-dependent DNA helicase RecQ
LRIKLFSWLEQDIGRHLIFETVSYAETAVCRRKQLLHYFGEEYEQENCGNCDNCLNPREEFDAQKEVELLLRTILALKENFKAKYISNFIAGESTSDIKSLRNDEHSLFGAGKDHDEFKWNSIIRQCIINNLLIKEIENYGVLKVSEKGHDFLNKPSRIMMVEPKKYDDPTATNVISANGSGGAADEELFNILKDLCKDVAKEEGLPPYVIFSEPSLEDMATQYPINMQELTNITGVGQGKAEKFGKPFLETIKEYVEENEIERPDDLVVKSVVNKSGLKVFIIQSIDRKMPLEDIAAAKGREVDDILQEIEHIVNSGTRVNLDYIINDLLDEEYQEEIFDYFKETEEDSIDDAVEEFDEAYSEEELRLMRIKFLSNLGN